MHNIAHNTRLNFLLLVTGLFVACFALLPTHVYCASKTKASSKASSHKHSVKKSAASTQKISSRSKSEHRGWEYLTRKLIAAGVNPTLVNSTYSSKQMPTFEPVPFSVAPKESHTQYTSFFSDRNVDKARTFLVQHSKTFSDAKERYTVDPTVVAAILLVETKFGSHTGKESVLVRLSRVASTAEPKNVLWNFKRLSALDKSVTLEQVKDRAKYLDHTFFPELVALFEIARRRKISLFSVKGSIAGAFGMPQFLPQSYLQYGADGDGDRIVSLYSPQDAIYSTAKFLSAKGWSNNAEPEKKRAAVWAYNRSDAYVDTVLQLANKLKTQ